VNSSSDGQPNNSFNRSANSIDSMRETWLYRRCVRPVNSSVGPLRITTEVEVRRVTESPLRRLNGHVQSAVQQLIEPEPMELDFHPQALNACDNPSGRVNSSVRLLA
jgi:hypothetical protein